jgi:hypothetical protein
MDGMEQRSWWNKTFWYMLRDVGVSQEGIIKENNAVKYAWCAYKEEAINKASPDLYSPPNDAVLHTTTPTLEWKNYCPRGQGCPGLRQVDWYEIQIIEASTGQVVVYDDVNYHTGDIISYIVPSGELTNTRYKWRVRFCNEDWGRCYPWSQPWYFTISY